jgi:deazaflavin-dependent oxidoreductase (nitroreductase family)
MSDWSEFAREEYCYLTTRGRTTNRPHRIEIWFAINEQALYMLSGGGRRSDWVRNLVVTPAVTIEIDGRRFEGDARVVSEPAEDELARALLYDKYADSYGGDLSGWRDSALPIAVDVRRHPTNPDLGGR